MSDDTNNLVLGVLVGIIICLVVLLVRNDFLQQQCDSKLIKDNKPRNLICVVRTKAIIVGKLSLKPTN